MRWPAALIFVLVSVCGSPASAAERAPALIANACATCHGPDGRSQGAIPSLAGMPADAFVVKMEAFRAGAGPGGSEATIMDRIAPGYSPAEIEALANYFSHLR